MSHCGSCRTKNKPFLKENAIFFSDFSWPERWRCTELGRFEFTSTVNAKMEMPTWALLRGVTGTWMLPGGCPTFCLDHCSSRSSWPWIPAEWGLQGWKGVSSRFRSTQSCFKSWGKVFVLTRVSFSYKPGSVSQ